MRLLKSHSHTSERLGYERRRNAKKGIEGKRRRFDNANHRQRTPADRPRAGGRQEEERRLSENAGDMIRETNLKTLLRIAGAAEGRDKER